MFVILVNYVKPLSEVDRFRPEHLAFLQTHYDAGRFLISGRREPPVGGVILCAAQSRTEVEALVRDDPFYREGVAEYEIIEFNANMAAPALTAFKTA